MMLTSADHRGDAERCRELGVTARHQIVIAMTAHSRRADHERCLAAGMDGYLAKPIRSQELDHVLQKYVAPRIGSEANATS
jgi:CheY-like chemotaxis protein